MTTNRKCEAFTIGKTLAKLWTDQRESDNRVTELGKDDPLRGRLDMRLEQLSDLINHNEDRLSFARAVRPEGALAQLCLAIADLRSMEATILDLSYESRNYWKRAQRLIYSAMEVVGAPFGPTHDFVAGDVYAPYGQGPGMLAMIPMSQVEAEVQAAFKGAVDSRLDAYREAAMEYHIADNAWRHATGDGRKADIPEATARRDKAAQALEVARTAMAGFEDALIADYRKARADYAAAEEAWKACDKNDSEAEKLDAKVDIASAMLDAYRWPILERDATNHAEALIRLEVIRDMGADQMSLDDAWVQDALDNIVANI